MDTTETQTYLPISLGGTGWVGPRCGPELASWTARHRGLRESAGRHSANSEEGEYSEENGVVMH
jgi:hypothetical protein